MGKIKRFIIERRDNPGDEWKKFKQFTEKDRAFQSLETLEKHRFSITKEGDYDKYRLLDTDFNILYYSDMDSTEIPVGLVKVIRMTNNGANYMWECFWDAGWWDYTSGVKIPDVIFWTKQKEK